MHSRRLVASADQAYDVSSDLFTI